MVSEDDARRTKLLRCLEGGIPSPYFWKSVSPVSLKVNGFAYSNVISSKKTRKKQWGFRGSPNIYTIIAVCICPYSFFKFGCATWRKDIKNAYRPRLVCK